MQPTDDQKIAALNAATALHVAAGRNPVLRRGTADGDETEVLHTADRFLAWLTAAGTTQHMAVMLGTIREQSDSATSPKSQEGVNEVQITDTQEFDVTVSTVDGRGFNTADAISYTVNPADGVVVVDLGTDNDSHTATIRANVAAGTTLPATATVTLTDGSAPDIAPASIAVVVTAGPTVAVNVAEGTAREQAPATPTTPPAAPTA